MNAIRRVIRLLEDFNNKKNNNHLDAYAASAAYFLFISLIPGIMLILTIIPYTPVREADVLGFVVNILPDSVDGLAVNVMDELYEKSTSLISITAIATLWAAARGLFAITQGLNIIYKVSETRNPILSRIRSAFDTILMILAVLACLLIMVFGKSLHGMAEHLFPMMSRVSGLIVSFRLFLTLSALILIFLFLYRFIPNRKTSLLSQIPGAVFSAIVWSAFSYGFSVYVDYFNAYSMYGSLTTVIILMFWLYFCMSIMFLGAQINAYFEPAFQYIHEKNEKRRIEKKKLLLDRKSSSL